MKNLFDSWKNIGASGSDKNVKSEPRQLTDAEWAALNGKYAVYFGQDAEGDYFNQFPAQDEPRENWQAVDFARYDAFHEVGERGTALYCGDRIRFHRNGEYSFAAAGSSHLPPFSGSDWDQLDLFVTVNKVVNK